MLFLPVRPLAVDGMWPEQEESSRKTRTVWWSPFGCFGRLELHACGQASGHIDRAENPDYGRVLTRVVMSRLMYPSRTWEFINHV